MQDLKAIRFIEGTKISHDYDGDNIKTFSYRELWEKQVPAIGIPCRPNNLLIVDVDVEGPTHKQDGTEFWSKFTVDYSIPETYTVKTPSGGFHFYFRVPDFIDADTFSPPGKLSDGIELKWNGWVGAPPTVGYTPIKGNLSAIQDIPKSMLDYISNMVSNRPNKALGSVGDFTLELATPFSKQQLELLDRQLEWMQQNAVLSRDEWRNGLFALKAGIEDPALLDDYAVKWTINKSYVTGDEDEARKIVERADRYGGIKPGTIFAIIKAVQLRSGMATVTDSPFTAQEILDRSKVSYTINKEGRLVIEASETNVASLVGAFFDEKTLYHDIRNDHYIFKGKVVSDLEIVNYVLPLLQSSTFGLGLDKLRKTVVANGIDVLMLKRQIDPHAEFIKNLKWDGVERIEKFFITYAGIPDSVYIRRVGLNLWTALAARGMRPGCKFDSMIVIEGNEGIRKSSLIEAIGGDYTFAPSEKDCLSNLDSLRQMHQSVIVELPELVGLLHESPEKVKAFLAKSSDNIRALFAKKAIKKERGFIFIGTTNSSKYLSQDMGIRRFWPVHIPDTVSTIDIDGVKRDREQLFAEGLARFNDGFKFWEMPPGLLSSNTLTRVHEDPLIGAIKEITDFNSGLTIVDIYRRLEASAIINRGLNSVLVKRIENSLRRLGFIVNTKGQWVREAEVIFNELKPSSSALDNLL